MKHLWILILFFHGVSGDEVEPMDAVEGTSVTLKTGVKIKEQDETKWYFNTILIADITGGQRNICTDEQCDERFLDRLKLDHQTGSLTIMNIRTADAGEYKVQINSSSSRFRERIFIITVHSVYRGEVESKYVMEGASVTLYTYVKIKEQEETRWYCNNTLIAEIIGDQSKICTDDQCDERLRDRLKLNRQTGSLTIMNIRTADDGKYKVQINSSSRFRARMFTINVYDTSAVERVSVPVMKEDSVTLNTGVETSTQELIVWYFKYICIAEITEDESTICTDDPCDERFRDRLKVDNQTGSLTIMNITNTDFGEYLLQTYQNIIDNERIFNVHGVSADERDEMKRKSVKEGESVTLDPGVSRKPNDPNVMKWYFNDILIAKITGDQSKICTDDQCDERFRDRLKLDHQTGSLTIMNTRITDEGEYKLEFNSIRFSFTRIFSVSVTESVLSSAALPRIISAVLLIFVAVVAAVVSVIYCQKRKRRKNSRRKHNQNEQDGSCQMMMTTIGKSARQNSELNT